MFRQKAPTHEAIEWTKSVKLRGTSDQQSEAEAHIDTISAPRRCSSQNPPQLVATGRFEPTRELRYGVKHSTRKSPEAAGERFATK